MFGFKDELDFIEKSARIIYESEEEFERVGLVLYSKLGKGHVAEAIQN